MKFRVKVTYRDPYNPERGLIGGHEIWAVDRRAAYQVSREHLEPLYDTEVLDVSVEEMV